MKVRVHVNILLLLIAGFKRSFSEVPVNKCAKIEVMQNFNLSNIMGIWHGISRYPIDILKYDCDKGEFSAIKNTAPIKFQVYIVVCKTPSDFENIENCDTLLGHFKNDPIHNPHCTNGKFFYKFLKPEEKYWLDFSIIDTDYTNYLVIYSCQDNLGIARKPKKEFVTILGRETTLSHELEMKVLDTLDRHKIDKSKLIPVSKNCYREPKKPY